MAMLIPDCWYARLEVARGHRRQAAPPAGWGRTWSSGGTARAGSRSLKDRCPHRSSQLSLGRIVAGRLQCPFHGFEFDGEGACQLIPANGRAAHVPRVFQCRVYPSQEAHGFVGSGMAPRDEYPPISWFPDLDGFEYATTRKEWDVNLTRAIEVCSTSATCRSSTPGRSVATRRPSSTGPIRRWKTTPSGSGSPTSPTRACLRRGRPRSLGPEARPLEFRFPNAWKLRIAEGSGSSTWSPR